MNVPWGHYAKWNKSDRERQIAYDLSYVWNLMHVHETQAYRAREQTDGCKRDGRNGWVVFCLINWQKHFKE